MFFLDVTLNLQVFEDHSKTSCYYKTYKVGFRFCRRDRNLYSKVSGTTPLNDEKDTVTSGMELMDDYITAKEKLKQIEISKLKRYKTLKSTILNQKHNVI